MSKYRKVSQFAPSEKVRRTTNYGDSYRSPYQKRIKIVRRTSAPAVLSAPPRPPPKVEHVSPYAQGKPNPSNTKKSIKSGRKSNAKSIISGVFMRDLKKSLIDTMISENSARLNKSVLKRRSVRSSRQVKNRHIGFRDGSIDIDIDAYENPTEYVEDEEDDEDLGINESMWATSFQNHSYDSIRSLRHDKHGDPSPTEYNSNRTHFLHMGIVYLILFTTLTTFTSLFVFNNYGFNVNETGLEANSILWEHNWGRVFLNAHMLLMIVPSLQLLSASSLLYRTFPEVSRTKLKWVHGSLSLIGSIFAFGGFACCVLHVNILGTGHFHSVHAILGLCYFSLHFAQLITGLMYILPCCSWDTRLGITCFHKTIGGVLLIADTASVITGCVHLADMYFDTVAYPQYYDNPYQTMHLKSVFLNMIGISCIAFVGISLYLQINIRFRRQKRHDEDAKKDPDDEAITETKFKRKSIKAAIAANQKDPTNDDIENQISGNRKSFNLTTLYGHHSHADKTIRILVNEAEKQKSNFNDNDFLISLE